MFVTAATGQRPEFRRDHDWRVTERAGLGDPMWVTERAGLGDPMWGVERG
jgi:hypothetical protein